MGKTKRAFAFKQWAQDGPATQRSRRFALPAGWLSLGSSIDVASRRFGLRHSVRAKKLTEHNNQA